MIQTNIKLEELFSELLQTPITQNENKTNISDTYLEKKEQFLDLYNH